MRIQPIVEGYGEVDAVPVLLRRLRDAAEVFGVEINRPLQPTRSQLVQESELRRFVRLAKLQEGCRAILVLMDSDDDCPKEWGPRLHAWASAEAADTPCAVVLAKREYEAWFLAAIESLRGVRGIRPDAHSHPDPESPRDAKGELESRIEPSRSYSERADQAALSAKFDLAATYARCRSFRKLVLSFGRLVQAMGQPISDWPPSSW